MKKAIYLFALLALIVCTSCEDEYNNNFTMSATINTRAIHGNDIVFSQGSIKVEIDNANNTIKFSNDFKDAGGRTYTLTTPAMALSVVAPSVYQFSSSAIDAAGNLKDLNGYIDLSSRMMWYTFTANGDTRIYSTTHLIYSHTTTDITDDESSRTVRNEQSVYQVVFDSKGEKCMLQIGNFTPNTQGVIQESLIEFYDITVTPTATGYILNANEAESSLKDLFKITDLHLTISQQGTHINGSFKVDGCTHAINGDSWILNAGTPD